MWKDGDKIGNEKRTLCEIFTRVMGYFRPVSHYNIGKKQEFSDRIWYKEEKIRQNIGKIKCKQK